MRNPEGESDRNVFALWHPAHNAVAPRVGAWIETLVRLGLAAMAWSPLAWGRGSKLYV